MPEKDQVRHVLPANPVPLEGNVGGATAAFASWIFQLEPRIDSCHDVFEIDPCQVQEAAESLDEAFRNLVKVFQPSIQVQAEWVQCPECC